MHEIKFSIKILSPVVISAASNSTLMTGSHDEISGSVIRGVLAERYVREKDLGSTAHSNENFQELFFGGLKFISATPAISGKRSFTLPLSLQRGKKGTDDAKIVQDLLTEKNPAQGNKSLRGYGIVDGEKIITASVEKNIFMHMSRSENKERISGKSEAGHIYNYEALEAGQIFCGAILGEKSALDKLNLKNFTTRLGRSRFTQYGKCEFQFGAVEEIPAEDFGEKFYLRLESPLVPAEDYFISAENILQAEVIYKLGEKFKLGKVFASSVEIENFHMTMKRPRVMALAAGTVFEVETKNLTDADKKNICEKIYSGFGTRTEEGFGQLRFWTPQNFTLEKVDKNNFDKPENFSAETLKIAQKILLERFLEQLRIDAYNAAKSLNLRDGNYTHFFARLDNILSTVGKKNTRQKFSEQIKAESKDGTLFQDNLKKIYIGKDKLFDVLTGGAKLPYEDTEILSGDFTEIQFEKSKFADEFCFEYLQNFFRAARKTAAAKGGGNND